MQACMDFLCCCCRRSEDDYGSEHQNIYADSHYDHDDYADHPLVGKRVRCEIDGKYCGGFVKSIISIHTDDQHLLQADVLLENNASRRFLTEEVEPVDPIQLGDYCAIKERPDARRFPGGFVRHIMTSQCKFCLHPMDTDYNDKVSKIEMKDFALRRAPPPVSDEVSEYVPPIPPDRVDLLLGRNKGIQGRNNSCYLDTLLFSMFAFCDIVLKDLLQTSPKSSAVGILLYGIVYPLRKSHFVSWNQVEYVRQHIAKYSQNTKFEGAIRDIPEAMDALFTKMLGWEPELAISSTATDTYRFHNTFFLQLFRSKVAVPRTKSLLYAASLTQKFCIEKVPNFFILQLPRETEYHSVAFPDLEIDLNPVLHSSLKVCNVCNRNASLQFPELYKEDQPNDTFLCHGCAETLGLRAQDGRRLPEAKIPDGEEPETRLRLSAVICIERAHYNCFVRCGDDRWVFFDSMSDQDELVDLHSGEIEWFNIPMITDIPMFSAWLNIAPQNFERTGDLEEFLDNLNPKDKPLAERLFKYSYMFFYST